MSKKIKKIDEFLDDDSRFDFNLTNDEIKELNLKFSLQSKENLKKFPERTTPNFTIEEYREIMLDLQRIDNFEYTKEERAELDDDCMEMYGEPFFKKDNNSNE